MLKIVDLQVGNIGSVIKAIEFLDHKYEIITKPEELNGATKILLPGVGSFSSASKKMFQTGFSDALNDHVLCRGIPVLGICVGMQLLAECGYEGGASPGLGFINAEVRRLNSFDSTLIVPHMGWNDVCGQGLPLFEDVPKDSCFYFVHSYAMTLNDDSDVNVAYTEYGEKVVAYINKGNIHGTQFHPEKSQSVGLKFLQNFIELC